MKIYTRTGDTGETSLFGGQRLPKSHLRIEAYGTVDELNSYIGLIRDNTTDEAVRSTLKSIQHTLFTIGSHLATENSQSPYVPEITDNHITVLETAMDEMDESLPALKNFILPGGHTVVSYCHIARCVCRRAERRVVALGLDNEVPAILIRYLNRLSDYFFVLARKIAQDLDAEEVIWKTA